MSPVSLTMSGGRLRREAALGAKVWPEAHVDQKAHLRVSQVHQGRVTPARLQGSGLGTGPEWLHLLLELQHDLAPERLAELELPGQPHPTLLWRSCSQNKQRRLRAVPIPCGVRLISAPPLACGAV